MTFISQSGPLRDSIRRSLEYQRVWYQHVPGHGSDSYALTIERNGRRYTDTFEIVTEGDVNRALNRLERRANERP